MPQGGQSIIMLVAMLAIFYFLILRPQKKKTEEAQKMREGMKIGDTVVTIGGIRGRVTRMSEDSFFIQSGQDGHEIEFLKQALSYVVKPVEGFNPETVEESNEDNADRLDREEEENALNSDQEDQGIENEAEDNRKNFF